MNRFVFYAHSGSGNHGCEAIVRSSAKVLQKKPVLFSMRPEQDVLYGINDVVETIFLDKDETVKEHSFAWFKERVETKLTGKIDTTIWNRKKNMLSSVQKGDIWFSIGGDNYCYPGTDILAAQNSLIHKKGGKTVLWGCSVEPDSVNNPAIAKDLAKYDLIAARESISYEALKKVNPNTVLVSDPAFTLDKIELPLPENWQEGNMIGINASPLILPVK